MPPSETTARQPPTAATRPQTAEPDNLPCPRCDATNTKFCYYNNYNLSQPRYFCKACRRYWTRGGTLRNVPVGGGSRKNQHPSKRPRSAAPTTVTTTNTPPPPQPPCSLPTLPVNTTSFYQPNEDDNHLMMSLNTNSFMSLLTANAAGPEIGLGYGLGYGSGGSDGGGMMMMMDGGDCVMGMGWLGSEQMATVGMTPPGKTGVKLETDYC